MPFAPSRRALLAAERRVWGTHAELGLKRIDGVDIAYATTRGGSDKTIVFIHGNSAGKVVFERQFRALAGQGFRLIAIDLPGHGCSQDARDVGSTYTVPSYARRLRQLFQELDIKAPLVVGWSLGGHIALEMAGRGYDLAALLITGTPPMTTGLADFQHAFLPAPAAEVTMSREPSAAALAAYVKSLYGGGAEVPSLSLDLARRTDGRSRETMGQDWARGLDGCCERTVVAGWSRPIAVIHGLRDEFISRQYLDSCVFRNLWGGRIIDFEQSGHAPFVEEPNRFNDRLLSFAKDVLG